MFQPVNLVIDGSNRVFVTDYYSNEVKIFNTTNLVNPIDKISGFNFNEKTFTFPDLVIKPKDPEDAEDFDKLFVSDTFNHVVKVFNTNTKELIATLGSFGSGDAQFNQPCGLALSADGTELHVVDMMNHRISVWIEETDGMFRHYRNYGYLDHGEDSGLYYPIDIVHYQNDIMYVTDAGHNRIVSFDDGDESDPYVVKKLDEYVGHKYNDVGELSLTTRTFPVLSVETDGDSFFLTDLYTSNVVKFDASWVEEENPIAVYGSGTGQVKFPKGMLVLLVDPDKKLYVADTMSGEIEVIDI